MPKAIDFKERNVIFAKDQDEYLNLPAAVSDSPQGDVVTCWELSKEELEEIQKTGKMWVSLWTFHQPIQPMMLSVYKKTFLSKKEDQILTDKNGLPVE